jgi:hypothetical protein
MLLVFSGMDLTLPLLIKQERLAIQPCIWLRWKDKTRRFEHSLRQAQTLTLRHCKALLPSIMPQAVGIAM